MNIYEKLIEVRKEVPYLKKENQGTQYNYVSSSQVLANCKAKMDELKLLLVPTVTGHKVSESTVEYYDKEGHVNKRTTTYFTELDLTMTWVNAEDPKETISCPWYGQGVDIAGEKGVGKALTYAEKYFMLKFFNIPTDKDDPDAFQQKTEGGGSDKPGNPSRAQSGNSNHPSSNASGQNRISPDQAGAVVIPFGQHKGQKVGEVPLSWVEWYIKNGDNEKLKKTCEIFLSGKKAS